MKKVCLTLSLFTLVFGLMAQTKFSVDKAHSSVNFKVKHNGISFVNGSFNTFDGFVVGDLNNLQDARIEFTVDARSIDTRIEPRDNHLRGADFFDTEKYPQILFKSTGIEKIDDKNYKLKGLITLKDVTKAVTFDVVYGGKIVGRGGKDVIGFIAKGRINRFDFNVAYDPDGKTIAKDVDLILYMEFVAE
ncbi:YceI family protein [Petrimonas mucosa]|jgi:polyisoprenoid-binding protein YceI|uniref:Protein YceI n=2 Tax=Dysgonomonadaceae TaxID=2005520 RepID=A0A1G4G647_9BACT|nr:YceI family protein [Petrimonas mucosa]SCM57007.1 Protein YceI [Petrimonas mucosa]SFU50238.1 Polyisoprenoid-binding protein YceI [Porphyromonadaceae bacterium KHP3R9]HHT29734.1 YceI family protein [Petrimonas mucosa]